MNIREAGNYLKERKGMNYLPIENYGAIGDLNTVALVSREGSIDFMCFPRFDSPSIFAALLDSERGGHFKEETAQPSRSNCLEKSGQSRFSCMPPENGDSLKRDRVDFGPPDLYCAPSASTQRFYDFAVPLLKRCATAYPLFRDHGRQGQASRCFGGSPSHRQTFQDLRLPAYPPVKCRKVGH